MVRHARARRAGAARQHRQRRHRDQAGIGFKVSQAIQFPTTFLLSFVAGFIWGWQMAAMMAGAIPILAIVMGYSMKIIQESQKRESSSYTKASGYATETLTNLRFDLI